MSEFPIAHQQSFETFVVTRSTADALAACRRLIDDTTERPAVCLLHGPSGTGKTHLLRAASAEARRRLYCVRERTALELHARLVESIRREPGVLSVTSCVGDVDLLVVDDLEVLAPLSASQEAIARTLQ